MNTGVGCHALLQRIFPTQESNPGSLHCRQVLYGLSHQGEGPGAEVKIKQLMLSLQMSIFLDLYNGSVFLTY